MATIMAIESSCDETAVSIIKDGKILCNTIASQIDTFVEYGGVVPEIASRLHEENFPVVLTEAIKESGVNYGDLDAVAVTNAPGLIGCLHIGLQVAKTISLNQNIPLISVNHIAAHIYAANITNEFVYPFMALVVSGGHTELVLVKDELDFEVIGQTLDDAIGESFDKVARVLDLPYPGGPQIDRLATGITGSIDFPKPKTSNELDFSYSGLKSAVINHVHNAKQKNEEINKEDIAASFQDAAISQLIGRTKIAIEKYKPKQLVLCGGVSANKKLRSEIVKLEAEVLIPEFQYCTDNGAMVAKVAQIKYKKKDFATLGLVAKPSERVDEYVYTSSND